MASLKDKVVVITGASSGIGAGTAEYFASLGSKLSLTGRNLEQLKATAAKCQQQGSQESDLHLIQADLCKDLDVVKIVEETVLKFNGLDVLVNNAGTIVTGSIESTTMEGFDEQMHINTRVPFHLMKLAVPYIKKNKGTIVNVSSVTGIRSFPNVISYCMSKAAVDQMTRCAAIELAQYGIRVNAVNPGVIETNVHKRGGMDNEAYSKFLEHSKTTHALGRVGTPDEVAKCIAFLASDDSSFITGATIPIDGGRHAMCPR